MKIRRKAASPDLEISVQVLLSCDELDFGCMGVCYCLFRVNQCQHLGGSSETTSPIPPARPILQKGTQMATDVLRKPNARAVKTDHVREPLTPKYMPLTIMGM